MRYRLIVAAGVIVGLAAGFVIGHSSAPVAAPPVLATAPVIRPPAPMIIPPGWDPSLVTRVNRLEQKLDQALTANAAPSEPPPTASEVEQDTVRQRERLGGYQRALEQQSEAMEAHAREPVDSNWASAQSSGLAQALTLVVPADGGRVKEVDCRSKTCAATLTFPSPGEALTALATQSTKMAVPGCRGFVTIPTPPTTAGAYDLSIIYNCR